MGTKSDLLTAKNVKNISEKTCSNDNDRNINEDLADKVNELDYKLKRVMNDISQIITMLMDLSERIEKIKECQKWLIHREEI